MTYKLNTNLKNTLPAPSKDFQDFITQYFEDDMYVVRNEYDLNLPSKLQGEELEVAKKIVIENIHLSKCEGPQLPYLAFRFNLRDLAPFLKTCFESTVRIDVKVRIGHVLYKWNELDSFIAFCKIVLATQDSEPTAPHYTTSGKMEIISMTYTATQDDYHLKPEESLELLLLALQDNDKNIRKEALWYLNINFRKEYIHLNGLEKMDKLLEDEKYYTSAEVYSDKVLFENRLAELRKLVDLK